MPFTIDKTFVVRAPVARVWDFLTDPRRVARCMPGAAVTEQVDEKSYAGTLTVKVGPVTASYKGKMSFARLDAEARAAEIVASGQDVRGKGGASMRLSSRLSERAGEGTEVFASSEVNVTGILAQMGRGMIQDVGEQIFQKFTDAMRAELEPPVPAATPGPAEGAQAGAVEPGRAVAAAARAEPPPAQAPPLDVVSLGAGAAARAAGRTVRRPAFWIAAAALALIAIWLWLSRAPLR
jgi:uncharacterized protein